MEGIEPSTDTRYKLAALTAELHPYICMSISLSIFFFFCGQYENRTRISSLRYPVWLHSIALTDLPINLIAQFVDVVGLEPTTLSLIARCSTN